MFQLMNGREYFFQWDSEQKLIIQDSTITEVHYCNKTADCSLVCEVYEENGLRMADVPNILLQTDWPIRVYAYCTNYTRYDATFKVKARTRPADYVYTETDIKTWDDLEKRIAYLEEHGGGGSGVGSIIFTDDEAGNVVIKTSSGETLKMTDDGNGNITMEV